MENPPKKALSKARIIDGEAEVPLDTIDATLREGFAKDILEQPTRLDALARQLVTLQIAIPGIYAAILKLVSGDTATLGNSNWALAAFIAWFLALILAWISLLPIKREIDPDSLTSIQNYFTASTIRKIRLLAIASILALLGIGLSICSIYNPKLNGLFITP